MNKLLAACLAVVLVGSINSSPVWARGGHGGGFGGGHFGGHYSGWSHSHGGYYGGLGLGLYGLGLGYYGSPYYSPYYVYPPAVVTVPVPVTPPVYIEQDVGQSAPAPQSQSGYWYYCADSQAYYPYVKECPSDWQPVEPQPEDTQ